MSPVEDIKHFILVYHLDRGEADVLSFGTDYDAALDAYSEREREAREKGEEDEVDIVLVGADSIETVQKTHSSYFELRPGSGFDQYLPA